ncbi:hypothetical protein U1Q18_000540, partial [Sarracenia purpurea var. burkii]
MDLAAIETTKCCYDRSLIWNIALAKGAYSVQIFAGEVLSYGLDGLSKVWPRVRVE